MDKAEACAPMAAPPIDVPEQTCNALTLRDATVHPE